MQRGRTATHGEVAKGMTLECLISLSEKHENVGFRLFSDFEWVTRVEILRLNGRGPKAVESHVSRASP